MGRLATNFHTYNSSMAAGELTGADEEELKEIQGWYYNSPQYENYDIPFETAYCLTKIGKQPDDYDGPQRFCKRRAMKKDPEDYEGDEHDEAAFAVSCKTHGGDVEKAGKKGFEEGFENPETSAITHAAYAQDEHLEMDFNDHEQDLYDEIMEEWPQIYDWPTQDEDPARYRILRRVAVNEVRAMREEDYLEDVGEIYEQPEYDDQGVQIGTTDTENPVSREYRLLMSEVTDQMRELGLTPKERQKMDTLESQADKDDALTEVASDALGGDEDYDPSQFDE